MPRKVRTVIKVTRHAANILSLAVYFMCKFPAHCGLGMVGTINAPSGSANGSFSSFQAAAMAIGANEANVSYYTAILISSGH